MQKSDDSALNLALRRNLSASASELAQALQVSQPSISRILARQGANIVRLGKARASRYALLADVRGMGSHWPLYRLLANAQLQKVGTLWALAVQDGMAFTPEPEMAIPVLNEGEFAVGKDGIYPGLPWWLDDQRPQGFLGRTLAQSAGRFTRLPPDIRTWQRDDVLQALLFSGEDLPGNWILGQDNAQRALRELWAVDNSFSLARRKDWFAKLADAVMTGEIVGSSAGGEQPKFTALIENAQGGRDYSIVKFSERTSTASGQRWADLLRCEHLAAQTLNEYGIAAAQSEIVVADERVFLQSTRFDRNAQGGRYGVVSLAALDAAHIGSNGQPWWHIAPQLVHAGWLTEADGELLATIGWFGELIGNSDMHYGNFSFFLHDAKPLAIAPVYDMLPMLFRPSVQGEIVQRNFAPQLPLPEYQASHARALPMALDFWHAILRDANISQDFKGIAVQCFQQLQKK